MLKSILKGIGGLLFVASFGVSAPAQAFDYYLLAASWQPGFCATHSDKPECSPSALAGTYPASSFSIHGLWPNNYSGSQPFYCGVSQSDITLDGNSQWCSMSDYPISSTAKTNLSYYMSGVVSCLDKHEWFKHGTCADSATPDAFWNQVVSLTQSLGTTSFNSFIQNSRGKTITRTQLLNAFSSSFGSGTQAAVSMKCTSSGGKNYFTEAWIALKKDQLSTFPAASSLVLDGPVQGTCPTTGIYVAN
jgi:ribonuclease T2